MENGNEYLFQAKDAVSFLAIWFAEILIELVYHLTIDILASKLCHRIQKDALSSFV